mmetsp:Transcript_13445/g.26390  ORF Transcript_13445/g.26390 Transcript_13445/m.26390 type:complete len:93 (-) Transcript_13445:117-395(-)
MCCSDSYFRKCTLDFGDGTAEMQAHEEMDTKGENACRSSLSLASCTKIAATEEKKDVGEALGSRSGTHPIRRKPNLPSITIDDDLNLDEISI